MDNINNASVNMESNNEQNNAQNKRSFDKSQTVYAWLCIIMGYFFCLAFPPTLNPFGLFLVTVICNGVAAVSMAKKGAKFGFKTIVSVALSVVFGFSYIVTSEPAPAFMAFICSASFYCYFIYSSTDNSTKNDYDILPIKWARALKGNGFNGLADVFVCMFSKGGKRGKAFLKILIGLVAAIVPTAIIISILSYDEFFVELIDKIFAFLRNLDIGNHIRSLLVGALVAMYLFGLYIANTKPKEEIDGEKYRTRFSKLRVAPELTVLFAVLPIMVVYIVFFISQWKYYVSGFGGSLPEGVVNYADYARSGFFELCVVSGINLAIIAVISLFMKRRENKNGFAYGFVTIVFSLMTLVLIGTAMSKMALYIQTHGLTAKRVLASWLMILFALLFLVIIIKTVFTKLKLFSLSAGACVLMVLLLVMSNYNAFIAEYNVDKYISGEHETVDVKSLTKLGTAAIPAMIELAEYLEDNQMEDDGAYLILRSEIERERIRLSYKNSIFETSLASTRAKNAINDYYEGLEGIE